jgi:ubiquinone/menaquinone biosynthesis C-methylase UbiE
VFRTVLGGNVHVPISNNGDKISILDVATGWGEWVKEVATEFPSATVYGLDIAPVTRSDVPSNCSFITLDMNEGPFPFEDASMDLVNSRYIFHHF